MSLLHKEAPPAVQKLIEEYYQLSINGVKVTVPYYRNVKHERAGLRSLLGKGTPEEINQEVLIYAKLRNFHLNETRTPQEVREFMQQQGIGIDCSGYVSHLLDRWLQTEHQGSLYRKITYPQSSLLRKIIRLFRPVENTSADTLTNRENANPVALKDVQPGDLLRLKGIDNGHHIAIITKVIYDDKNLPTEITYTHSTSYYGNTNGVRIGTIRITNPNEELAKQEWLEQDDTGHCWTLEQLLKDYEDNGLRRLKFWKVKHD